MKFATIIAAAAFALAGASAASAQNSLNAVQTNVHGDNSVKNFQKSKTGNFAGVDQTNVFGDNKLKNKQITGKRGYNDGQVFQGNEYGRNDIKNSQIQGRLGRR